MAKVWIGDFRTRQLQYWHEVRDKLAEEEAAEEEQTEEAKKEESIENDSTSTEVDSSNTDESAEKETEKTEKKDEKADESDETISSSNYIYITEDNADYTWFDTLAMQRLATQTDLNLDIIIMLGLNDCINSCIWKDLTIQDIADKYIEGVKKLKEKYAASNIYFCSVNPVNDDYPSTYVEDGLIAKKTLASAINDFNDKIKEAFTTEDSTIIYIDSSTYLKDTGFSTRDSVWYDSKTCLVIHEYVSSFLQETIAASFTPRTTKPETSAIDELENGKYWISTSYGGLNIWSPRYPNSEDGSVLPNCVSYVWGRFYEILGSKPNLNGGNTCNASKFFEYTDDGYERGQTPREGAIICWSGGLYGGAGHVAIVEEVHSDGSITLSESGWSDSRDTLWRIRGPITNKNGCWGLNDDIFNFQGFIYNPGATSVSSTANVVIRTSVDKSQVTASNAYLTDHSEAQRLNAQYIWQHLASKGWTLNAVAALLGNMQSESGINPGLWEDRRAWGNPYHHGFGLVQWTPYTKYTNWCKNKGYEIDDIDGQLERITWEAENEKQWNHNHSPRITFSEFIHSQKSAHELGGIFMRNYEVPAGYMTKAKFNERGNQATTWYEYLQSYTASIEYVSPFSIRNFKIDKLTSTEVTASFIISRASTGEYIIYDKDDKEIVKETLDVSKIEKPKEPEASSNQYKAEEFIKVVKFNYNKLLPNTEYKLAIKVIGENNSDELSEELTFSTPQSLPKSATALIIKATSKELNNKGVKFTFTPPKEEDWGYWKKNSYGYEIHLIVNGKSVASSIINSLTSGVEIIPDTYFNYETHLGDSLQIGLRTWVKDDKGNLLFNSKHVKASNPICLLNSSFRIYLKPN